MKTNRFEGIDTIEDLVISLFPFELDETAYSNKPKRDLSQEWIEWYVNGKNGSQPIFKYETIEEFAFGLWPKWHDEKDNFFKDRRDDLIELIKKWTGER